MEIVTIWRNFLAFSVDFFGVSYHLRTFFRPWHLLVVHFEEGSAVEKFFFNIASRIIGRVMGAIMRSGAILIGLLSFGAFFLAGIALELLWL
ncbi:hypothetical protein HYZ98_04245, partial [Candidatus Peregrinibacteria bacterium]|nr:hypothetical protein [Candidatus Peregrinibacteria bacterium]